MKPYFSRETTFSPCRRYRYTLWREWGIVALPLMAHSEAPEAYAMFIGLNPSTADEMQDDPTIRRCVGFAKLWGFGALCMTNLFALRATDPSEMMTSKSPIGESNLGHLLSCAVRSSLMVAAWGADGGWMGQDEAVLSALAGVSCPPVLCLGVTKAGFPSHPLYLPRDSKLRLLP